MARGGTGGKGAERREGGGGGGGARRRGGGRATPAGGGRAAASGSPMSSRQTKVAARSYPVPEKVDAEAASKLTRSATPWSPACLRAISIEPSWYSDPLNREFGYSWASRMVDAPSPQPISATWAPARSLSSTPSSAGIQDGTRLAM